MPEELQMNTFSSTSGAPKRRSLRHLLVLCVVLLGSAFYALGQDCHDRRNRHRPVRGRGSECARLLSSTPKPVCPVSSPAMMRASTSHLRLRIGHYTVRAEATGFKRSSRKALFCRRRSHSRGHETGDRNYPGTSSRSKPMPSPCSRNPAKLAISSPATDDPAGIQRSKPL